MFTYNLIELNVIPKMLGSQNDNADQLRSQYREIRTGIFRENRLGCLLTRHRAVNQGVNFYFRRKRKTAISPPIFSLFQTFFSEIRDYSSTTTLTQKSKFEENCRPEGVL